MPGPRGADEPSEALGQISISLLTFQQLGGICFRSSDGSKPVNTRGSGTVLPQVDFEKNCLTKLVDRKLGEWNGK